MRDLAEGMCAGISAYRSNGANRLLDQDLPGAFELTLDRAPIFLALPADKMAAVVFDNKAEGAHGLSLVEH